MLNYTVMSIIAAERTDMENYKISDGLTVTLLVFLTTSVLEIILYPVKDTN